SRSGRRRYRPRRMSPSKFSSLTSLSKRLLLGLRTGQQDRAQIALRALGFLDPAPRLGRLFVALTQVVFKGSRGSQVTADDRIHVGQTERVIGLDNGLGRGPGLERTKDQFQEHPALADAKDSRRLLAERHRNGQRLEIKHCHGNTLSVNGSSVV